MASDTRKYFAAAAEVKGSLKGGMRLDRSLAARSAIGIIIFSYFFSMSCLAAPTSTSSSLKTQTQAPVSKSTIAPPIKPVAPSVAPPVQQELNISVERVFIRNNHIIVALTRSAAQRITTEDFLATLMKLQTSKGKREWRLAEIDKNRSLTNSGKIEFDTGIILDKSEPVTATLVFGKIEKPKQEMLLVSTTSTASPATKMQMKSAMAGALNRRRTAGSPLNLDDSGGIRVTLPGEGQVQRPRDSMPVHALFLRELSDPTAVGDVEFSLRKIGSDDVYATVRRPYRQSSDDRNCLTSLTIPRGLTTSADYYVMATHPEAWGIGNRFSIQVSTIGEGGPGTPLPWGIRMVTPGSTMPVSWPRGSTHSLAWRLTGSYPSDRGNFTVQLKRGGDTVLTIPGTPVWHANSESYTLDWHIPADLSPASDYRIQVISRRYPVEAISGRDFAVTGPIQVFFGGGTRYIGNPANIEWRLAPGHNVRYVRVVLMGEADVGERLTIAARVPAGYNQRRWVIGANGEFGYGWQYSSSLGPPITGRFKVRVSDVDDPGNYGDSNWFTIAQSNLRVWTSDSHCTNGKRIHWESSQLVPETKLAIILYYRTGCIYRYAGDSPYYYAENYGIINISTESRPSGNFCWKYGQSADGAYARCRCIPSHDAFVSVFPIGFEYVANARSASFDLPDTGCSRRDPFEDY